MNYQTEFILQALELNFLQQQVLEKFLDRYSHSVPENIAEVFLREGILSREQVDTIIASMPPQEEDAGAAYAAPPEPAPTADYGNTQVDSALAKPGPGNRLVLPPLPVPPPQEAAPPTPPVDPASAIYGLKQGEVILGKYRIMEKLGSGGMGVVYKVQHVVLEHNNTFALKMILPQYAADETVYKRFLREVELSMRLVHRNIITIREFGLLPNQAPYMVMDFVDGKTLQEILKDERQIDMAHSVAIIRQVLEGLKEAHSHNVIHRDIKPANIIITNENDKECIKLLDFGLAKLIRQSGQDDNVTQGILGTPFYMAPEQLADEHIDQRVDLYAVGLILYEMVVGQKPFHSKNVLEVMYQQIHDPLPRPSQLVPSLPLALDDIIIKASATNPDGRYQNAQEFIAALDALSQLSSDSQQSMNKKKDGNKISKPIKKTEIPDALDKELPGALRNTAKRFRMERRGQFGETAGIPATFPPDFKVGEPKQESQPSNEPAQENPADNPKTTAFAAVLFAEESSDEQPDTQAPAERPAPSKWQPLLAGEEPAAISTPATSPITPTPVQRPLPARITPLPPINKPGMTPGIAAPLSTGTRPVAKPATPQGVNVVTPARSGIGKRKSRFKVMRALVLLFLLALAGIPLTAYLLFPEWLQEFPDNLLQKKPEEQPVVMPQPVQPVAKGWFGEKLPEGMAKTKVRGEYLWHKDNSHMAYVAEGIFWRGDDSVGNETEKPARQIILTAFYIDKYELTNEQYLKFIDATGHDDTPFLSKSNFNETNQPVVGITWQDAQSYAQWAEKRLPTEAEWEKAARGGVEIPNWQNLAAGVVKLMANPVVRRRYPWGNEPLNATRANSNIPQDGHVYSAGVGSFQEGVSPYTCHDMAGNVWEWCEDTYQPLYYRDSPAKNPLASSDNARDKKVCRGGSWRNSGEELSSFRRNGFLPGDRQPYIGVRLAR